MIPEKMKPIEAQREFQKLVAKCKAESPDAEPYGIMEKVRTIWAKRCGEEYTSKVTPRQYRAAMPAKVPAVVDNE